METYTGHVRTPADAIILFEACRLGLLPRVQRRLSEKERQSIKSGSVFVWDEREAGMRRWTDGKSWSASRVSGSFLTYREMEGKRGGNGFDKNAPRETTANPVSSSNSNDPDSDSGGPDGYRYKPDGLIKQSFSITTTNGQHLHLISYFSRTLFGTQNLAQPSSDPQLRHIRPEKGLYPEATVNDQTTVTVVTPGPMPSPTNNGTMTGSPNPPPAYPRPPYAYPQWAPPSPMPTPPQHHQYSPYYPQQPPAPYHPQHGPPPTAAPAPSQHPPPYVRHYAPSPAAAPYDRPPPPSQPSGGPPAGTSHHYGPPAPPYPMDYGPPPQHSPPHSTHPPHAPYTYPPASHVPQQPYAYPSRRLGAETSQAPPPPPPYGTPYSHIDEHSPHRATRHDSHHGSIGDAKHAAFPPLRHHPSPVSSVAHVQAPPPPSSTSQTIPSISAMLNGTQARHHSPPHHSTHPSSISIPPPPSSLPTVHRPQNRTPPSLLQPLQDIPSHKLGFEANRDVQALRNLDRSTFKF